MVSHMFHVHVTLPHTESAAVAAICIYLNPDHGESVEESVDRSERADKTAECAIAECAGESYDQHDYPFAGKENSQLVE